MIKFIFIVVSFALNLSFAQISADEQLSELFQNNRLEEILKLSISLNKDSLSSRSLYIIGIAYYDIRGYEESIHNIKNAINKGPVESYMYYYIVRSFKELKRNEEAMLYVDEAINKFPEKSTHLTEKAELLMDQDKFEEAQTLLHEAITKETVFGKTYYLLGKYYFDKKKETRKALEVLLEGKKKIEKEDDHYNLIIYELSLINFELGDYRNSNSFVFELLSEMPDAYILFPNIIQNYFALQDYDSAAHFRKSFTKLKKRTNLKEISAKNTVLKDLNGKTIGFTDLNFIIYQTRKKIPGFTNKLMLFTKKIGKPISQFKQNISGLCVPRKTLFM